MSWGASRWFLHQALQSLDNALANKLNIFRGDPSECLHHLAEVTHARAIYWNRRYAPWRTERDAQLKSDLKSAGLEVKNNGSLLWEPWQILKVMVAPTKYLHLIIDVVAELCPPRKPLHHPNLCKFLIKVNAPGDINLNLLPGIPWHVKMRGNLGYQRKGRKINWMIFKPWHR